jgi:hypothetical protein
MRLFGPMAVSQVSARQGSTFYSFADRGGLQIPGICVQNATFRTAVTVAIFWIVIENKKPRQQSLPGLFL